MASIQANACIHVKWKKKKNLITVKDWISLFIKKEKKLKKILIYITPIATTA